jgi:nitrogen regulatory protein PII
VPFIINLLKNISNEDIDDTVIITPVINVLRIRTEEEGPDAID